jgi:tetratricopeptide (TPR) repeat protein
MTIGSDSSGSTNGAQRSRARRRVAAVAAVVAVAGAALLVARALRERAGERAPDANRGAATTAVVAAEAPPYPASPYRNARPGTAYAGDDVCALCHAEIVESFGAHGMARTLATLDATLGARTAGARVLGDWSGRGVVRHAPSGYAYTMLLRDGRHIVRETRADAAGRIVHEVEKVVDAVIGSGDNDQGFLAEEDGAWYVLPVEWYTTKGTWDMAPGFEGPHQERWKRRLLPGCIGCHASYPDYVSDSGNRYRPPLPDGIGCERCHGPGALHADARMTGAADTSGGAFDSTIVNPRRLSPVRQIEVCAQCHLQADVRRPQPGRGEFDYRPGLPLGDFKEMYVPAVEDTLMFGFVRHVERMVRSRCFVESGRMTCTTCHSPHATSRGLPASHWAEKCLSCHAREDCPETVHGNAARGAGGGRSRASGSSGAQRDAPDCVGCHMRRSQPYDVPHVAIADHWIRRTIEPPATLAGTRTRARGDVPLVAFSFGETADATSPAALAGLGIALVAVGHEGRAVGLLDRALSIGLPPREAGEAHLQRAIALAHLGRRDDAHRDLDRAMRIGPASAEAAFRLGQTCWEAQRPLDAAAAFRAGLAANDGDPLAWANLAIALGAATPESLDAALDAARRAVAIAPGSDAAQRALGMTLLALGQYAEAERPLRAALRLSPVDAAGWLALGDALGRATRFDDAIAAFRRAVEVDPRLVAAWGNMALAYTELGNTARARALLDTVAALDPRNPRTKALQHRIERIEEERPTSTVEPSADARSP